MVAVYHSTIAEALADPRLSALSARGAASTPFSRLDWLALLAAECLPGQHCSVAVAHEADGALAALPYRVEKGAVHGLANWYSFTAGPLFHGATPAQAAALLAAIARSLVQFGAVSFAPLGEPEAALLSTAFRRSGWIGASRRSDTNHVLPVNGRTFAEYWAARPGALRETVRRKRAKGRVELRIATAFDPADWAAYEAVYARSWKPSEGSPAFLRRFAQMEGAAGALRLGLALIDGQPVAAQFWTVEGGTAFIHKLAHDDAATSHSPGTLLTAALFEHVIDRDKVALVDFGTGDDPYKRDWMDTTRPRWRVEAFRPGAVRHWPGLLRMAARRLVHGPASD
nr:GNAT family N-acetyltransferase [Novosphingobium sp. FKTRR1]